MRQAADVAGGIELNHPRKESMKLSSRINLPLSILFLFLIHFQGIAEEKRNDLGISLDYGEISSELRKRHSYSQAIKSAGPSVVRVVSHQKKRGRDKVDLNKDLFPRRNKNINPTEEVFVRTRGEGSGVIVTPDGYVLTNYHQVEGADWVSVILNREDNEYVAKTIGADPRSDLALLKIEGENFPAVAFGDSDQLEVGDVVIAVGNPFGIGQTSTIGIVSALGRSDIPTARNVDLANFIQTDASINPGNSGGALIDPKGRLVGINAALLNPDGYASLGIGFAIPANQALSVFKQLRTFGEVRRGYLGISVQKISPALAHFFNLNKAKGALVTNVFPNTPASQIGIQEEDIITHLNGVELTSSNHFRSKLSQVSPGQIVEMDIIRQGKRLRYSPVLKEHSLLSRRFMDGGTLAGLRKTNAEMGSLLEGTALSVIDDIWRRQLNIPDKVPCGVVLSKVEAQSPMGRAGILAGTVILRVGHQNICELSDLLTLNEKQPKPQHVLRIWHGGRYHYKTVYTFR